MSQEMTPKEYSDRLFHLARQEAKRGHCTGCNSDKERKVVGLYEYGDPYIPSSVMIFCPDCTKAVDFATRPYEDAIRWAKYLMEGEDGLGTTGKLTGKIMDLSILGKGIVGQPKKSDPNVIKDDKNKFIASPEQVKEREARQK